MDQIIYKTYYMRIHFFKLLKYSKAKGEMIEVVKMLNDYHDNVINISLSPHFGVSKTYNNYKLYQNSVK